MAESTLIRGDKLTAYERWELGGFAGASTNSRSAARQAAQSASEPGYALPTADDIERIHQEAHKNGYAVGYEEGTARARLEAMHLHSLTESLDHAFRELDQQVAQGLLTLALEIARQVVRHTLEAHPDALLAVIREALSQLPHQHVSIYLHPDDASLVRSYLGDQLAHSGHRIFEEPAITRGGCRLEAAGSHIDATLEMRWKRVLESLSLNGSLDAARKRQA